MTDYPATPMNGLGRLTPLGQRVLGGHRSANQTIAFSQLRVVTSVPSASPSSVPLSLKILRDTVFNDLCPIFWQYSVATVCSCFRRDGFT